MEDELNFTLQCSVFNNDIKVVTEWFIQRDSIETVVTSIVFTNGIISTPEGLADDVTMIGDNVPGLNVTYLTNFTILNFTSQFDWATIECGISGNRRTFNLGFQVCTYMIMCDGI